MTSIEWMEYHDDILRNWKKQAAINLWLALASKYRFDIINNWLTYPCIVISASTSIGILGLDKFEGGKYALSSVVLFSAILTAISKHFGAAEKSQEFYMRSKDYFAFIRELDYILSLHFNERNNVIETLTRLKAQFDRIMDQQLDPPLDVIRQYEQKFKPLDDSILQLNDELLDVDSDSLRDIKIDIESPATTPTNIMMPYQLYLSNNRFENIMSAYASTGRSHHRKSTNSDDRWRKSLEQNLGTVQEKV